MCAKIACHGIRDSTPTGCESRLRGRRRSRALACVHRSTVSEKNARLLAFYSFKMLCCLRSQPFPSLSRTPAEKLNMRCPVLINVTCPSHLLDKSTTVICATILLFTNFLSNVSVVHTQWAVGSGRPRPHESPSALQVGLGWSKAKE